MTKELSVEEFNRLYGITPQKPRFVGIAATDMGDGAREEIVVSEICRALVEAGFWTPARGDDKSAGFYTRVQQHDARNAGSDQGAPDVLVFVRGAPLCLGFEVKRRGKRNKSGGISGAGKASSEQQKLLDAGCTFIVRSAEEVIEIVKRFQRLFQGTTGAAIKYALERKA